MLLTDHMSKATITFDKFHAVRARQAVDQGGTERQDQSGAQRRAPKACSKTKQTLPDHARDHES
jgi:hypothetical protein